MVLNLCWRSHQDGHRCHISLCYQSTVYLLNLAMQAESLGWPAGKHVASRIPILYIYQMRRINLDHHELFCDQFWLGVCRIYHGEGWKHNIADGLVLDLCWRSHQDDHRCNISLCYQGTVYLLNLAIQADGLGWPAADHVDSSAPILHIYQISSINFNSSNYKSCMFNKKMSIVTLTKVHTER